MERRRTDIRLERSRCPYCHEEVTPEGLKQGCPSCMAWHHIECWTEGGRRCSSCGFDEARLGPQSVRPDHEPRPDPEFARLLLEWPGQNLVAALREYRAEYDEGQLLAIEAELKRRAFEEVSTEEQSSSTGWGERWLVVVLSWLSIVLLLTWLIWLIESGQLP